MFLRNRVSAFPDRGARRPHESGDLVGIFDAGFTFDARRNVDPRGTGYAQGLADIVGVKPARKHERDTGLHRLEKMPIKSIAEPAWAGGVAWRARIKQQPIDHSSVMTDTLKVRPYRNWQSLHDWQAEHPLHRLNLRDGFCAVQLQNVRPQSLDDGPQKRCIGINGERSVGLPQRQIGPLAAIRKVSGNADIQFAVADDMTGSTIPADQDGVVVVPRAAAAQTAQSSQARVAKEEKTREKLRAGELGLDYYGLRAKLKELGVEFVEE